GDPAGARPSTRLVETAAHVAAEVQGDVAISRGAHPFDDPRAPLRIGDRRDVCGRHLDPRDLAVVPHPACAQSGVVHRLLRAIDLAEQLERDRRSVREARRQARQRGLVPHLEPERARQRADVVLAQTGFVERAAYAVLARRGAARAPVAFVVAVVPVDDVRDPALARDLLEPPVELALAEIAAVHRIRRVRRIVHFARFDDLVPRGDAVRERERARVLALGERLAARRDADGALAQLLRGDVQNERRVDAAGERDDAASELAEDRPQARFLRLQRAGDDVDHRASSSSMRRCTTRATCASGSSRSRAIRTRSSYSARVRVLPFVPARFTRTAPYGVSMLSLRRGRTMRRSRRVRTPIVVVSASIVRPSTYSSSGAPSAESVIAGRPFFIVIGVSQTSRAPATNSRSTASS